MHRLKLWSLILVGLAAAAFWAGLLYGMFPPEPDCSGPEDVFTCQSEASSLTAQVVIGLWIVMLLAGAVGGVLFYFYTREAKTPREAPAESDPGAPRGAAGAGAGDSAAGTLEVRCDQVGGVGCPYVATGSDATSVREDLMAHIASSHAPALDNATPAQVAQLEGRIDSLMS